jgi:hypothetical protein
MFWLKMVNDKYTARLTELWMAEWQTYLDDRVADGKVINLPG